MPRASPTQVIEQRLTLGTYERNKIEEVERIATRGLTVATVGAVAMPLAIAGAAAAVSVGLVGFGLSDDLDREAIRNLIIGTPSISRTKLDGSEQVINNPVYGIPIIGPLFGTGLRIGEYTAEGVTGAVGKAAEALESVLSDAVASGFDVSQGSPGDGGGGGSRTGIFGGSVFM